MDRRAFFASLLALPAAAAAAASADRIGPDREPEVLSPGERVIGPGEYATVSIQLDSRELARMNERNLSAFGDTWDRRVAGLRRTGPITISGEYW